MMGVYTVSAGFATVHGNNTLTINAVEAYEMDSFSPEVCSLVHVCVTLAIATSS
jgi:hypothetical protein